MKGSSIFVISDDPLELLRVQAVTLSNPFRKLMALRSGTHSLAQSFQVGQISSTPFPKLGNERAEHLARIAAQAFRTKRELCRLSETDHNFTRPRFPIHGGLSNEGQLYEEFLRNGTEALSLMQTQLDVEVAASDGFSKFDLEQLLDSSISFDVDGIQEEQPAEDEDRIEVSTNVALACSLLQWAVGSVYGRWDIRRATGKLPVPKLPDPFDPLPVCSPGMLQRPEGFPALETPEGYPLRIDWDGILVDDPDHPDDIIRRVRDVLEVIWKDRADAIEKEACEILGVADLRDYFRKPGAGGFWDDHVKRYSKSRRKAPIYWLLQSSKKNYALWIYYHRLDKDILFKALLNYVEPKIRREESRLDELRSQKTALGPAAKGAKKLDKDIDRQEAFLSELRDFEDKLRRAANLHLDPDLNDGVVLNIAPLRELVPWKEAKSYWDDLMDGKYEWSSIGKQLREKGVVPC